MQAIGRPFWSRASANTAPVGNWYGLDTAIRKVAAVEVEGRELIKCPPESLSYQIRYSSRGRR